MELRNEFRVAVPVETAWKVLSDLERIAPCLPGAQLQEVEGNEYRGIVKVKVGPITAQYKGKATIAEQDEAAGRVVLTASGRDTGGGGNANATITATMVPDGDGTKVSVLTNLAITGRLAQFGGGVLSEVSAKLLAQFVDALEHTVLAPDLPAPPPEASAHADDPAAPPAEPPAPADDAPAVPAEPDASVADAPAEPPAPPADAPAPLVQHAGSTADAPAPQAEARVPSPAPAPVPEVSLAATLPPVATASGNGSTGGDPAVPTVRRIDGPEVEPVDLFGAASLSLAKRLLVPVATFVALFAAVVWWRRRLRR